MLNMIIRVGMRKVFLRTRFYLAGSALVLLLAAVPVPVFAYSGTGLGTVLNPYKVANCSQLQDIQNDLDAYYRQTGDIDCAVSSGWNGGAGFVPIGRSAAFTGNFDGQGFKIKNIHINADDSGFTGMFAQTNGATLENVHLEGGAVITDPASTYYSGSLVGYSESSTISSCSSTTNVSGQYGGGIVGYVSGGTLSECWYGGSTALIGYRYTGGMFGLTVNTVISDVYSKGTLQARGGIAGVIGTGTSLSNAYSVANVTYNETDAAGGLFGSADGVSTATTVSNIFFDGTISAAASSAKGGVIGSREGGATVSGAYYNSSDCNCSMGIGTTSGGSGTATAVNVGGSDPAYFRENSTNSPMNSWNFSTVWQVGTGSYEFPVLRAAEAPADGDGDGAPDTTEKVAPNSGDANNDGTADSAQTNVTSFVNSVTGNYASVSSTCDSTTSANVSAEAANAAQDSVFDYPMGLTRFTLACNTAGQTATVTLHYFYTINPGTVVARKYNSAAKTYQALTGATISNTAIGGQGVLVISYQITDGSSLDEDGLANGVIVDPTGLAASKVAAPNTGLGGNAWR